MKEEKENKQHYLLSIEKQTVEQGEKISRADKNLRKAQKDIQNLYVLKRDDIVLLQQVKDCCIENLPMMNCIFLMIASSNAFQREVELRELQEQNALVLQDIAEFTIRHVEAEAYVKKLLIAKNIELPSFPPSIRSSISPYGSSAGSLDQLPKSTSRTSFFASSRESIGSVVKIEPQFEKRTRIKNTITCIYITISFKYLCITYLFLNFHIIRILESR